jgi:uncharacterized membrane protein YvlD (DUF360 family)
MLAFSQALDSVTLDGPIAGLLLALVLGAVNGGALFLISRLSHPIMTLGLAGFLLSINIVAILVGGFLLPGASEIAVIGALYMAIVGGSSTALFAWSLRIADEDQPDQPSRSAS